MSESYMKMEASGTCPRRDFNNQLLNTGGRLQSSRGCWWKRGISGVSLHVDFIKPMNTWEDNPALMHSDWRIEPPRAAVGAELKPKMSR